MFVEYKLFFFNVIVLDCLCIFEANKRTNVNIAIFLDEDKGSEETTAAIRNALNIITAKTKYHVVEHISYLHKENTFEAVNTVCKLAAEGVAAIFGPETPEINEIIQSVSSSLQIPHFQTFWNPKLEQIASPILNLHPSSNTLSQALATLVRDNDWKSYTVIYENEDGLVRLRETLKQRKPNDLSVTFRKLGSGPDYRSVLKQIKSSEDFRFILDCKADRVLDVLRQAREVKLLEDYHSYILTDLDSHSLDWTDFKDILSNISTIRLVDPENIALKMVGKLWRTDPKRIKTRTALMYDAINVFITAFRDISQKEETLIKQLDCMGYETSEHGKRIYEGIRKPPKKSKIILPGYLTGRPVFDRNGQRKNFDIQIIEMTKGEADFRVTGTWNSANPKMISYKLTSEEREKELRKEIQQKNFKVVSRYSDDPAELPDQSLSQSKVLETLLMNWYEDRADRANAPFQPFAIKKYLPTKFAFVFQYRKLMSITGTEESAIPLPKYICECR